MNLLNRALVVVTLLALIALATVVLLTPREAVDSLAATLAFLEASPFGTLLRIVVCLLIIVLGVVGLYYEFRRAPRSRVLVGRIEGAIAELSVDAIAQRLRREIMTLPGIRTVQTAISPKRNDVDVRLTVITDPDVDVPAKAAEVARLARENLESRMGLRVGRLWVNINHDEASTSSAPTLR